MLVERLPLQRLQADRRVNTCVSETGNVPCMSCADTICMITKGSVHLSRALAAPRSTAPAPQPRRPYVTELRQRPPTWLRQSTAMRSGAGVNNKVMFEVEGGLI